jgi:hypothetical protein
LGLLSNISIAIINWFYALRVVVVVTGLSVVVVVTGVGVTITGCVADIDNIGRFPLLSAFTGGVISFSIFLELSVVKPSFLCIARNLNKLISIVTVIITDKKNIVSSVVLLNHFIV